MIDSRRRQRLGIGRRLAFAPVLLATLAALLLTATAGVGAAGAAAPAKDDLRLAVLATYRVDPANRAVHVVMDITATNEKPDTATTVYYYDSVSFGVPLEATGIKATSNGSTLSISTTKHDTFRGVTTHFPNLYHGKTRKIRQTFDLPSGRPRSDSPVRVGKAYVAFEAWAWGDHGLGDVRIILPAGFTADITTVPTDADAQLTESHVANRTEYAVNGLDDPIGWYSRVTATDQDALTDVAITAAGEPIVIHGWPEDPDWIGGVSATLKDSLPDLEDAIGLPWPVTHDLDVTEVAASEIEGYAGFFDSSYDRITISEEFDDLTTVHEASHAWFDGGLFQERWIDEGLADEYASRVLAADHPGRPKDGPDPVSITDKAAFDLNTWRPPGRIDEESAAYEQFGYDASWKVVRAIVDDVGETRMRDVFKAAAARTVTYVGSGPAETSGFVPDWRRFLDLVTDVGGSKKAEDLLETWVLTPKQDAELTARDAARATYVDLVRDGGDWLPGIVVRKPMSEWRFEAAKTAMTAASKVLAARDVLTAATTELGVSFPADLEAAYESASTTDDLAKLETTIDGWSEAATSIRTARDGLAAERSPLVQLGLLDADPAAGYRSAVAAFEAGDRGAVTTGTAATIAALADAEDIGRGRATMVGVAVVIAITFVVLLAAFIVIRRRRQPAAFAVAPATPPRTPDEAVPPPPTGIRRLDDPRDPYATLAATSDLVEEAGVGAPGARGAEPD